MAKFAPVVPLGLASWLKSRELLGDYHLLLAHDVIQNPKEYSEVYGDITQKGGLIIMDNSLIELGHPVDADTLAEACHIVGARYAVMPDVLDDAQLTYDMSEKAIWNFLPKCPAVQPVFVLQGQNLSQCLELCLRYVKLGYKIGTDYMLSIPRRLANTFGTRRDLVAQSWKMGVPVHLLGFSNSILDDITCARMPGVVGIDSTEPIRLALQHSRQISLDWPSQPGPREDYWEKDWKSMLSTDGYNQVMASILENNLNKVRKWIADPTNPKNLQP